MSSGHLTRVAGSAAGVARLRVLSQRRVVVLPLRARVLRPRGLIRTREGGVMICAIQARVCAESGQRQQGQDGDSQE